MSKDGPVLTEMNTGGVRWHVQPECQELLLGADGLRLQDWLRAGWAQIVKHGPHRTVYRIALPGLSVYLKHYRLPDFRAWLRQLVRPAKARMEYDRALAVAQRAVPTIEPLGLGIAWGGAGPGESYLITRSLEDAAPLNGFVERTLATFPEPRQTAIRQRLAVALGRLVARLHDAGIVHHDLHAANILVRLEPNDRPLLYLVDLHAVQLRAPLAWPQSQANLILLNRWFILRASRTDRLRFWHAYCRCRETFSAGSLGRQQLRLDLVDHPETRNRGRELEAQTWQSNLRFWRNRDRRCLVTNRYYYRVSTPAIWGCAVRDVTPEDLAPFLADPDGPFRAPALPLLKDSRSSTVAELDLIVAGERKQIIYKRFRATDWRDRWLPLIRRTAALRSWIFGHGLRERCLPTARPLAVLHRRRGLQTGDTYLITEKIPDARDLHAYCASQGEQSADARRSDWRRRIDQVAQLVGDLHRRQVSHRDLKASNVLLTSDGVFLIDLVGIRPYRRLSVARRVQNLARLHASFVAQPLLTRTDKLRFLRTYLQWGLRSREGWKGWWRRIEAATQAKVIRNQRNQRPLT